MNRARNTRSLETRTGRRRWLGPTAWAMVGVIVLLAFLAASTWRSPPFYTDFTPRALAAPIMTMAEYGEVFREHPRPYVVSVESDGGALLLYGATHTRDPDDPQIADIGRRWRTFRPTVALVEGQLGFLVPAFMDPVRRFGEAGAVNALARGDGIPVYSWEPPREVEIARVLEEFPAQRAALFYVLRPYFSTLRHGRPDDPDAFVEAYRRKRTRYPGLENALGSVEEIDAIWRRDFAGLPDWRETSDEHGLPGYLGELSARSNALRDEHLVHVMVDLVDRGARVFAVAGSSHGVKVEAALRAAFDDAESIDRSGSLK